MPKHYDAIVIGTGQAGPSLTARLSKEGLKTAVIERDRFGGTCVNNGCTPTKAMVASARAAYMARRAADFGVTIDGSVSVDMKKVKQRKDAIVAKSNQGLEGWLGSLDAVDVYRGHGRFTGPQTVSVGDDELLADRIFVNVGGRAFIPPVPGLSEIDYLTNESIMDVDVVPERLIVLGGGYIGLEFGQMFRRFGSEVTIVQRSGGILSREDDDIVGSVESILRNEGVEICTDTGDYSVEPRDDGVVMHMQCGGRPRDVAGSHLLVATGRRPNTDDLGLDKAGIETDLRASSGPPSSGIGIAIRSIVRRWYSSSRRPERSEINHLSSGLFVPGGLRSAQYFLGNRSSQELFQGRADLLPHSACD